MKVRIGDKVYDGNDTPVMVILEDIDKENIRLMPKDSTKYCSYPHYMSRADIEKWMNLPTEEIK